MSLEACSLKLKNARAQIDRVKEFVNTNLPDSSASIPAKYKIRLDAINSSYKEFLKFHDTITLLNVDNEADENTVSAHAKLSVETEDLVFELREILESVDVRSHPTITSERDAHLTEIQQGGRAEVRLPPLSISSFDGNYNDWTSFYDLFLCTVHNNASLKNVQKMQYLKSLLKGEPLQLVRNLPVTDANYDIAWNKLLTRYNKKSYIVQQLIKKFIDQPSMSGIDFSKLRSLTSDSDEIIRSLSTMEAEARDPWIIHILSTKLDSDTRQLWASKVIEDNKSSLEDFFTFLGNRCDAIETFHSPENKILPTKGQLAIKSHHSKVQSTKSRKKSSGKRSSSQSSNSSSSTCSRSSRSSRLSRVPAQALQAGTSHGDTVCPICKDESHHLHKCKTFKDWNVKSRWDYVRSKHLCFNCLFRNHTSMECKMNFSCQSCKQRHHTLLHEDETKSLESTSSLFGTCHHASEETGIRGILPTVVINCRDVTGNLKHVRAILDTGSENSFITESCMELLNLSRGKANLQVRGISESESGRTLGKTQLELSSRFNSSNSIKLDAYILSRLTSQIPQTPIDRCDWKFVEGVQMADPDFHTPNNVDIIIGSSKLFSLLLAQRIIGSNSQIAQNTIFGFIMTGEQKVVQQPGVNNFHLKVHEEQPVASEKVRCFCQPANMKIVSDERPICSSSPDQHKNFNQNSQLLSFGFILICINMFFLLQVFLSPDSFNTVSHILSGVSIFLMIVAFSSFVKMSPHSPLITIHEFWKCIYWALGSSHVPSSS